MGNESFENTEAQVKRWIRDVLEEYNVYYFMPVQSGLGASGLDFHCVVNWCNIPYAFFIEAKEFGKLPTDRQDLFIENRRKYQKAKTFVIDGMVGVAKLRTWLQGIKEQTEKINKRKMDNGHSNRV